MIENVLFIDLTITRTSYYLLFVSSIKCSFFINIKIECYSLVSLKFELVRNVSTDCNQNMLERFEYNKISIGVKKLESHLQTSRSLNRCLKS